jgi:hypothetical protein
MMPAALKGGCVCGEIRYEVTGAPFHQTNCQCSICRRTTGAPFVTWFSVRRSQFRIVAGEAASFRSSRTVVRCFCSTCGTQLTFTSDDYSDEIGVTTCSLYDPEAVPPRDHTRTSSKLRWIHLADGLPEYPEARPVD